MAFFYVKIHHGPYTSFISHTHKTQCLNGLRERLRKLGFRVDLLPVDYPNYCMLEMCGYEIFRCNIRNLKFNTPYYRDKVCKRAIDAVVDAAVKFRRGRGYLWNWSTIDNQLFTRGPYGPKDAWLPEIDVKPLASCMECLDCCNILVHKLTKEEEEHLAHEK